MRCPRAANRMIRRLTFKAFERWVEAAGDVSEAQGDPSARRSTKRQLSRAFDGWIDAVAEMQRRELVVRRAIHSIMNRIRRSAFNGWLNQSQVVKRIRALSNRG